MFDSQRVSIDKNQDLSMVTQGKLEDLPLPLITQDLYHWSYHWMVIYYMENHHL